MKLSAPKLVTFLLALAVAVVALLIMLDVFTLSFLSVGWVALIAFAVLALGNLLKGV